MLTITDIHYTKVINNNLVMFHPHLHRGIKKLFPNSFS
jgi:hypothetical protein